MKITISIPKDVYNKLELDRGAIPRSTYIQEIIKESGSIKRTGAKLSSTIPDLDPENEYEIKERVVVKHKKELSNQGSEEFKSYLNKEELK